MPGAARCRRPPPITGHGAGFHSGRPPRNKGRRYPADPPTVEEIVAVMRQADTTWHGLRLRGLIVVLWRAGLRIHEALALTEADLDARPRRSPQGRPPPRSRHGRLGLGATAALAGRPRRAARRSAVLRAHRSDQRPRLVAVRGARATASHGRARRRPAALRAASASPRARRRDGARGCPTDRLSTPARHTPTSASPRSTCRASTAPRSSTPSTPAGRRWCQLAARCGREFG